MRVTSSAFMAGSNVNTLMTRHEKNHIIESKTFVWRNLKPYVTGQKAPRT